MTPFVPRQLPCVWDMTHLSCNNKEDDVSDSPESHHLLRLLKYRVEGSHSAMSKQHKHFGQF